MALVLKQSTAVDALIGPFLDLTDAATAETGESPAVKLSKNGQSLGAKSDATTPVHDADGYYNCELDATDTDTVGQLVLTVAASANALPVRHEFYVVEEAIYNAVYGAAAQGFGAYDGPRGPGVYLDDAAGNTNTEDYVDGTIGNPVSTIGAAKTIADSLSFNRVYLVNDTEITIAASMADYEFVGIGEVTANVVNLGGEVLTNSAFFNLTIEGDGSSSAGRIYAEKCALQDPGPGVTTLHIFASACGIVDDITVDTSADNVFDQCYSLVAGTSAPTITASGAAGTVSIRHYSGGVELKSLSASHNVSVETDGQVIFNSNCNVNATVVIRGNATITDNTAGMASLTQTAMMNRAATYLADMVSISGDTTAADNLEEGATAIVLGQAAGTPTTTVIDTDLTETTNDHYKDALLVFTSGNLAGQRKAITGYNGTTKALTCDAFTDAASATDTFVIV